MTDSKHPRIGTDLGFDHEQPRWYHYALRRLPQSLLISIVTLLVGVPMLLFLLMTIYRWIAA